LVCNQLMVVVVVMSLVIRWSVFFYLVYDKSDLSYHTLSKNIMEQISCPDGFVFTKLSDMIDHSFPPNYSIDIDSKQFVLPRPIFRNFLLFHEFTDDNSPYPSVFSQLAIQEDDDNKLFDIEKYVKDIFTIMMSHIKHFTTITAKSEAFISGQYPPCILLDDSHPNFESELDYIQKNFPQVPIDFFTHNLVAA
jgi:hypothetical protein